RWVAPRERARLHSPQPETDLELKGSLDDLWLLSVDCGLRAADCSDVEQQVLSLPGADDLQEGLVLVLFDSRVSDDEPLAEHLDERTAIAQQPQGILYVSRQRKRHVVRAPGDGLARLQAFHHSEIAARERRGDGEIWVRIGTGDPVLHAPSGRIRYRHPQPRRAIVVAPLCIDRRRVMPR